MGKRVLIIEDEVELGQLIQTALKAMGCHAVWVPTAREAIAALDGQKFDEVLTDINLPDMDGFDFIASVKWDGERIWVMSGHISPQDPRLQHKLIQGFFEKPFRTAQLKKMI